VAWITGFAVLAFVLALTLVFAVALFADFLIATFPFLLRASITRFDFLDLPLARLALLFDFRAKLRTMIAS